MSVCLCVHSKYKYALKHPREIFLRTKKKPCGKEKEKERNRRNHYYNLVYRKITEKERVRKSVRIKTDFLTRQNRGERRERGKMRV